MATRKSRSRRSAAKQRITLHRRTRAYGEAPPIPPDAVPAYRDALKGLQVASRDRTALVKIFRVMLTEIAKARNPRRPFMRGLKALHDGIGAAVAAKRLNPVRAEIALKVPWAILCQWLGCQACIKGDWGQFDNLLIGCHPSFSGWVCVYLPVPRGFCP